MLHQPLPRTLFAWLSIALVSANGRTAPDLLAALLPKVSGDFDHIHLTTIAPSFATWLPRTFDEMRTGTVPHPAGGFRVTPAQHPGVGEQQPASHPFLGRVVVLTDGGTFSTAADVAAQLRSRRRAIFVGEETGGTYEGNTSALNALIVLPNSQLRLKVMMYGYWNAVVPAEPGRGIVPDHTVVRRIADILRGVDPVMERALALLRQGTVGIRGRDASLGHPTPHGWQNALTHTHGTVDRCNDCLIGPRPPGTVGSADR